MIHTSDLAHKRPIVAPQTGVPTYRRVAYRYGNPLPETAAVAGAAAAFAAHDLVGRVGQALAVLWIIR